jgi:Holliday junction resolvase RusA-like endonuclease
MRINIKALSVNNAWKGKRFKTREYDVWRAQSLYRLPSDLKLKFDLLESEIELCITFGVSNKSSDLDNLLKPFIDSLQEKYKFNDKKIKRIVCEKEYVAKGNEYIDFELKKYS